MEDGQIAHIQYEHDGALLQEQQVWKRNSGTHICYWIYGKVIVRACALHVLSCEYVSVGRLLWLTMDKSSTSL